MQLEFAFICDYAEPGEKISALGIGFDTIYATRVPFIHPNFHLVAQFRASIAEAGNKELAIRLIDADGKDVVPPFNGILNIPQPQPGEVDTSGKLVVGFGGVQFNSYGQYALHVVVQGNEVVRIPIRVAQPPSTG
ncbi:MAG TPA: hypothetical protein PLU88_12695 [Armatimonadota bacterium]|nr:hypothetical protein [Armatimonadota bacterium]